MRALLFVIVVLTLFISCIEKDGIQKHSTKSPRVEKDNLLSQIQDTNSIPFDTLVYLQEEVKKIDSATLTRYVTGSLNADNYTDIFCIIERRCNDNDDVVSSSSQCYSACIFVGQKDGGFKLSKVNHTIIACNNCEHRLPIINPLGDGFLLDREIGACVRDIYKERYTYSSDDQQWKRAKVDQYRTDCNPNKEGEVPYEFIETLTDADFGLVTF